jgi:glutathione S-transferase
MMSTPKPLEITSTDQTKPETNNNFIRLYSHHLCAYSEKARLTLGAKGVPYHRVDVDLKPTNKTKWHIDTNGGTLPMLELTDGTIIFESRVIMEYLEDAYPH